MAATIAARRVAATAVHTAALVALAVVGTAVTGRVDMQTTATHRTGMPAARVDAPTATVAPADAVKPIVVMAMRAHHFLITRRNVRRSWRSWAVRPVPRAPR